MDKSEQLQRAIAALEAQRSALGDDVVNAYFKCWTIAIDEFGGELLAVWLEKQ